VNASNDLAPQTRRGSAATVHPLTRDFLAWVARRPRSYADAMEAWRSSCPRFTIWEDAIADGLIGEERGGGRLSEIQVVLTPRGRAVLDAG
jgi:hypothetical protein